VIAILDELRGRDPDEHVAYRPHAATLFVAPWPHDARRPLAFGTVAVRPRCRSNARSCRSRAEPAEARRLRLEFGSRARRDSPARIRDEGASRVAPLHRRTAVDARLVS
jgi:hypothetical protein